MYVAHKCLLVVFGLICIDLCSAEPAEGIFMTARRHQTYAAAQTVQLLACILLLKILFLDFRTLRLTQVVPT